MGTPKLQSQNRKAKWKMEMDKPNGKVKWKSQNGKGNNGKAKWKSQN